MKLHAAPCISKLNLKGLHAAPVVFEVYTVAPCCSMQLHAAPCSSMRLHAAPCGSMRLHAAPVVFAGTADVCLFNACLLHKIRHRGRIPYLSDCKWRLTLFCAFILCGLLSRAVYNQGRFIIFHRSISVKIRITQSVTTSEVNILITRYELRTIEA